MAVAARATCPRRSGSSCSIITDRGAMITCAPSRPRTERCHSRPRQLWVPN